ncbi:hypothetical protein SNE40_016910 [Patella caerulea]|uniref:Uncharacterized protein n=1 Tax=Patella caerulea TaxID=87958 RepID=A0AAN8JA57_PATCE
MNVNGSPDGHESYKQRQIQKDSINREMKSHQMNSAQDKLLELSNLRLDKILDKEARSSRNTTRGIQQEQQSIHKCTPPTEIWLKQHEAQYQAWKDREREKLLKRHKSVIKSYRLPSEESCERQLKLVRSKTFLARDKSPPELKRRGSVHTRPTEGTDEPTIMRPRRRTSRRNTVSFSDVSSRRSSVDSL